MGFLRRLLGDREPTDEPVAGAEAEAGTPAEPGPADGAEGDTDGTSGEAR